MLMRMVQAVADLRDDMGCQIDGVTNRTGALLIANSWGSSWGTFNSSGSGSRGFMWVAYDYFKENNNGFGMAFYNEDRDDYRPQLYACAGLNHAERNRVSYRGGVGTPSTRLWHSYWPIDLDGGNALGIDDSKRVAVDLTEGIPSIDILPVVTAQDRIPGLYVPNDGHFSRRGNRVTARAIARWIVAEGLLDGAEGSAPGS